MSLTTFSGPVVSQNGFIDTSFTTAERDAIVNPQPGLLIYNTDTNTYEVCTVGGGAPTWDSAFSGGGGGSGPNITSVAPSSGGAGANMSINGTGFDGTTSVTIGGVSASFFYMAPVLFVTVPSGVTPGPVDVTVTTPLGSSTEVGAFTYTAPAGTTYTQGTNYTSPGLVIDGFGSGTRLIINQANWFSASNWMVLSSEPSGTVYQLQVEGFGAITFQTFTSWDGSVPGQITANGFVSSGPSGPFTSNNVTSITFS